MVMGAAVRLGLFVTALVVATAGIAAAQPSVVGGERVSLAERPWVVYLTDSSGFQYCGGALVASDKVVTAGHCAVDRLPEDVRVVVGREDKLSASGQSVPVDQIWLHPGYRRDPAAGADVAVLTLTRPVRARPVPISADRDRGAPGRVATVLGWGRTSETGPVSEFLMGAQVPIASDDQCRRAYAEYDSRVMLCAGYKAGGVDTCQGDSGGPLVVDGELVGITSFGEGCARAGKYGVYTRVASYAPLIQAQLGP